MALKKIAEIMRMRKFRMLINLQILFELNFTSLSSYSGQM